MTRNLRSPSLLAAILVPTLLAAADVEWSGATDGNWSTATNWNATPVDGADDVLRFGTAATITTRDVNVDVVDFDVQNINITDSGNWTFGGNALNWGDFGGNFAPRLFIGSGSSGTTTFNIDINNISADPFRIEMRDATGTALMNGDINGTTGLYATWVNAGSGGTITLAGTNTFTGGLTVDFSGGTSQGGVFEIAAGGSIAQGNDISIITDPGNSGSNRVHLMDGGAINFAIGDSGMNDSIASGGGIETKTVLLDGDFIFDLTGAATITASFWDIVDMTNLAVVFGNTFTLSSTLGAFTEVNDVWTINENGVIYEFSEATGQLSVSAVPEPGTYALVVGALSLLCVLIRRGR